MIEGCKTDIVSEKAKAVSSLGTAESCPICFSEFGELLLIACVIFFKSKGARLRK